jgi:GrpB-like predicted nucleotidyltransferase (UPF0157 family)
VDALTDVGLGLAYGTLRLERTTEEWLTAGSELRDSVTETLVGVAVHVEQIGSSSVLGLLAKPIVDLAIGLSEEDDLLAVTNRLEVAGWINRGGDTDEAGGRVFVCATSRQEHASCD